MITFEQKPASALLDVCNEVSLLVKLNSEVCRVTFADGRIVLVSPGDTAWTIERNYYAGARQADNFRNPIARTPYAD